MNFLKGYKTVIFNLAAIAAALVSLLPQLQAYMSPTLYAQAMLGVGVSNLVLRFVTNSPVFKAE